MKGRARREVQPSEMPRRGALRLVADHLLAPSCVASVGSEEVKVADAPLHPLLEKAGAHHRANLGYEDWAVATGSPIVEGANPRYGMSTRDNTPLPAVNSFGVSSVLPGYGILPKKVRTASEALECVRRDGAVILTGLTTELSGLEAYKDTALALPKQIFGDELLSVAPPAGVGIRNKEDAEAMMAKYKANWGKPTEVIPPWGPNCAHTDGEAYGDRFPPYLFLLFAHASDEGGENAIVNSQFVVEEMERSGDPHLMETAELLRRVPVDQTQYGAAGATGIPCVSPIVQTLPNGRTMIKMATSSQQVATAKQKAEAKSDEWLAHYVGHSLEERAKWDEEDAPERDQQMIDTWKDAVFSATAHAPRFKVLPGEALIIDNYRGLHVREGYSDMRRSSWRVWMWAEGDCFGEPDTMRDPKVANTRGQLGKGTLIWA